MNGIHKARMHFTGGSHLSHPTLMAGDFIDTLRVATRARPKPQNPMIQIMETDFGNIRVLDTKGDLPVIVNVPDGPNVIEHHERLIALLSKSFRVICFEFPGFGFSYPTSRYDYSLDKSAKLVLQLMNLLKVDKVALSLSCANGFYGIKVAEMAPDRIQHLFLAQTPSLGAMKHWVKHTIPKIITLPVVGQLTNSFLEKKFAKSWYSYALPKGEDPSAYQQTALNALNHGSCFCLSGLVQGLMKDQNSALMALEVPATLVWGNKDFTHRKTDLHSILDHLPGCELIPFENCGHFPELEDSLHYVQLLKERLS